MTAADVAWSDESAIKTELNELDRIFSRTEDNNKNNCSLSTSRHFIFFSVLLHSTRCRDWLSVDFRYFSPVLFGLQVSL